MYFYIPKNVLGPTYNTPYGTTIITHQKAITLLVAAMSAASFASACAQTSLPGAMAQAVSGDAQAEAVLQNTMTPTSVRKFKQQPVEDAKVEALLRAGAEGQEGHRAIRRLQQVPRRGHQEDSALHLRVCRHHPYGGRAG